MRIVTVTLNTALDVTYHLDELTRHTSHRVRSTSSRAGGKGINVARVLHTLGHEVLVTGLAGGARGHALRAELGTAGIAESLSPIENESRQTVTVVDSAATAFNEAGPHISEHEWQRFLRAYERTLADADAVTLCGSLPEGVPVDAYASLARLAARYDVPAILDAQGEALLRGCQGRPAVAKPNAGELASATGQGDVLAGAQRLCRLGASSVAVSSGRDGILAVAGKSVLRARPPVDVEGNATGAGDAAAAALAVGVATGQPCEATIVDAVALSAAAVHTPAAGEFDAEAWRRYRASIRVEHAHHTGTVRRAGESKE